MNSPTLTVAIPRAFYDDHTGRELLTPPAIRTTRRHYVISLYGVATDELLDDADHYAHPDGPDMIDIGLKASARATAKAIRSARKTAETAELPIVGWSEAKSGKSAILRWQNLSTVGYRYKGGRRIYETTRLSFITRFANPSLSTR